MSTGKGRSFSREVNDQLRDVARRLRKEHASDRAFAKALRIAQPTITNFLNGGNAGIQVAMAIASSANLALYIVGGRVNIGAPPVSVPWRTLPGWDEAIAQARALFPKISAEAWEWLGSLSGPMIPDLAPAPLGMIAGAFDAVDHRADSHPARSAVRSKKAR